MPNNRTPWTPEPWVWESSELHSITKGGRDVPTGFIKIDGHGGGAAHATCWGDIHNTNGPANAARIVACVNACAGIADPKMVQEMVELLRNAREEQWALKQVDYDRFNALLARIDGGK